MTPSNPAYALDSVRAVRSALASIAKEWAEVRNNPQQTARLNECIRALYALETVSPKDSVGYVKEAAAILSTVVFPDSSGRSEELDEHKATLSDFCVRAHATTASTRNTPAYNQSSDPVPLSNAIKIEKVDVAVEIDSESNFYTGISGDISAGGVFVATHTPQPIGAKIRLNIYLFGSLFGTRGQVAWLRETGDTIPGMGVRFLELDLPLEQTILKFAGIREPLFQP